MVWAPGGPAGAGRQASPAVAVEVFWLAGHSQPVATGWACRIVTGSLAAGGASGRALDPQRGPLGAHGCRWSAFITQSVRERRLQHGASHASCHRALMHLLLGPPTCLLAHLSCWPCTCRRASAPACVRCKHACPSTAGPKSRPHSDRTALACHSTQNRCLHIHSGERDVIRHARHPQWGAAQARC